MRTHILNYTMVGLFVSVMVIALIWSLISISGRTGPTDRYSILMDNVTDIDYGTIVRYEGYRIGQVEEIHPDWSDGHYRFRLEVSVRKGWQIPKDSIARIASTGFLAAKTVDINAGKSNLVLTAGETIESAPASDIFTLMAGVAAEIGDLSEQSIKPLITNVSDIISRLGTKTEGNLDSLFGSLIATSKEIEERAPKIADDLNTITDQAKKFVSKKNAESVSNILTNVETVSQDATTISADIAQVSTEIRALAEEAKTILEENRTNIGNSVGDLQYVLRTLSQRIDSLTHNLDSTARNLNEFSRLIRQQPGLLLRGGTPEPDKGLEPTSSTLPTE